MPKRSSIGRERSRTILSKSSRVPGASLYVRISSTGVIVAGFACRSGCLRARSEQRLLAVREPEVGNRQCPPGPPAVGELSQPRGRAGVLVERASEPEVGDRAGIALAVPQGEVVRRPRPQALERG